MHVIDRVIYDIEKELKKHRVVTDPFDDAGREICSIGRAANRFVFGTKESEFVGRFIRDFGAVIIDNRQFAISPYENTYIEFDINALLRGVRGVEDINDEFEDAAHGYVIRGNHVFSVSADKNNNSDFSPLHYHINSQAEPHLLFSETKEENDWKKLAFCMGSALHDIPSEEDRLDLLNSIKVETAFPSIVIDLPKEGFWGEVRNLFAFLLLLNKHSEKVQIQTSAPKGVIYKGKRRVLPSHSVVKILLDAKEDASCAFTGLMRREGPRRHQVRGFFRNYHPDETCEHSFPLIPNEKEQWICPKCGTIRVWVKEFERGDASKGYVTKEYQAKTRVEE